MATENREVERLVNERAKHKGEWLTDAAVSIYQKKINELAESNNQDAGERRKIRIEFQEKYGLLEIEAINILNGFYVSFYIDKYQRIKSCTPVQSLKSKENIEKED